MFDTLRDDHDFIFVLIRTYPIAFMRIVYVTRDDGKLSVLENVLYQYFIL
jgi:hypothetical protein